jgi:nucleoside-diphosphate-sugar epimerase
MNILITGAANRLAQAIAEALGREHHLRLMDRVAVEPPDRAEFFQGDILDPDDAWRAVRGMQALIHTASPPPDLPAGELAGEQALLELGTRGTHELLSAAVKAGIRRCAYAGTLDIFSSYPDDVYISENWKPLPPPEMGTMSNYLGELVCREFAWDYRLTATSLRLGRLVEEEETEGLEPDPLWLDLRDAALAFQCALRLDRSDEVAWSRRWSVYHICADIPNPRCLIDRARSIGYEPVHNFQDRWQAWEK